MLSPPRNTVHKKSSLRLRVCVAILNHLHLKRIVVRGLEHLQTIRSDQKIIIVTTHLGDLDVPAAMGIMGEYVDLVVANESVQHFFWKRMRINLSLHLAGIWNFLPIEYQDIEHEARGFFHAADFLRMKRALDTGKTLLVAGHNPALQNELPRGGYGAVYVHEITDRAVILPVTVNVRSSQIIDVYHAPHLFSRPIADLIIHPPMHIKKITNLEQFTQLAKKRLRDIRLTPEEHVLYAGVREALQVESDKIMRVLASALPQEKRGKYH